MDNKISNVIGVPIPQWLVNQFNVRSSKGATYTKRNVEELQFLSNKTAWVRVVSSVNIKDEDLSYFSKNTGQSQIDKESSLSENFILFAGTSKYQKQEGGYSTNLRTGVSNGSYGMLGEDEVNRYGYTPMPGITSVTIETMGRMGSVRSATVNFRVFNKAQLDIIDALYFKLGYTMLLEWGHTYYYETESDVIEPKLKSTEDLMINPFLENLTKEKINYQIALNVKKSYGNYDGMLGVVTNYNFSRKEDGSYECSIKIIGLGALAESLKINKSDFFVETLKTEIKELVRQENLEIEQKRKEATRELDEQLESLKQDKEKRIQELNTRKPINQIFLEKLGSKTLSDLQKLAYLPYQAPTEDIYDTSIADLVYKPDDSWAIRRFGVILNPSNITKTQITLNAENIRTIYNNAKANSPLYIKSEKATVGGGSGLIATNSTPRYQEQVVKMQIQYPVSKFSSNVNVYLNQRELRRVNINLYKKINIELVPKQVDKIVTDIYSNQKKQVPTNLGELIIDQLIESVSSTAKTFSFSIENKQNDPLYSVLREDLLNVGDTAYSTGLNVSDASFRNIPTLRFSGNFSATIEGITYRDISYTFSIADSGLISGIETIDQQAKEFFENNQAEIDKTLANDNILLQIENNRKTILAQYPKIELRKVQEEEASKFQSALEEALRLIQIYSLNQSTQKNKYIVRVDFTKKKNNTSLGEAIFGKVGLFSDYYSKIISGEINQADISNYGDANIDNVTQEELLKFYIKYGFNTSVIANAHSTPNNALGSLDPILPVNYLDLLESYVIPYEVSQQLSQGVILERPVYIKLGTLLMLINHLALIYDYKEDRSIQKTPIYYVDYNPETNFCLSSLNHLSTNPFNFIIPYSGTKQEFEKLFDSAVLKKVNGLFDPKKDNIYSKDLPNFIGKRGEAIEKADVYRGKIMNVLIDVDYLLNTLKTFSSNDNNNSVYFKSFMDKLLSDMCKALGNFNLLRLAYNDAANCFYIVDDQLVPGIKGETFADTKIDANRYEIPLYGNTSIAKNLEIRTDISSRLSNMVAISANSEKYQAEMGTDSTSFGFINKNFRDRYIPIRADMANKENKQIENTEADVDAANRFNQAVKFFYGYIDVPLDYVNGATNYYITRFAKVKSENPATRASAIIPVSVNFTTDGISGFNMYQSFGVNEELLPYTYTAKNKMRDGGTVLRQVGFCVVGLTHTIQENQWNTSVKSNMIFLRDLDSYLGKSNVELPERKEGIQLQKNVSVSGVPDKAVQGKKVEGFGKVSADVPLEYRPLLDTIAYAEGTSNYSQNGYNVLVGFKLIDNWSENYTDGHPNILIKLPRLRPSSAAGRYQFIYDTWKSLGLSSFSKKNQDIAGWKKLENLGVSQDIAKSAYQIAKSQISSNTIDVNANRQFISWLNKVYRTWVSIPNGNNMYSETDQGGQYNVPSIYKVYIEAVKKY